jgi:cyanophycinase
MNCFLNRHRTFGCIALCLFAWSGAAFADDMIPQPKGWLVLHGGWILSPVMTGRFASLAGLPGAPVVVIPTAEFPNLTPAMAESAKDIMARFFGATNVVVLHAKNRQQADSEGFVQPLRQVNAVWILGGTTKALDRYVGTKTEAEIKALYARGGVVGGSSAGALILGSFKLKLPQSLKPNGGRILQEELAFGLLPNTVVQPHFAQWHRGKQTAAVIAAHPGLMGLGIDEDTGAVVHGGELEVLGPKSVHIFEKVGDGDGITLHAGEKYQLRRK